MQNKVTNNAHIVVTFVYSRGTSVALTNRPEVYECLSQGKGHHHKRGFRNNGAVIFTFDYNASLNYTIEKLWMATFPLMGLHVNYV